MTVLEVAGDVLEAAGAGVYGTSLFLGEMPADPDVCTAVAEFEGTAPAETFRDGRSVGRPRVQVICRGAAEDYAGPRDAAVAARAALLAAGPVTTGDLTVLRFAPAGSGVLPLGPDQAGRHRVAVTFIAWTEQP
ncbi:MAG: minor capsid protein [Actinomycetota bacterium]